MRLDELLQQPGSKERAMMESWSESLHVAAPGEIVSYNPKTRTASIQLCIRRPGSTDRPPVLQDVPVFFPGNLLFPVSAGEECLVVFADRCIDAWHAQSGVVSPVLTRRHDLSDGFAFVGFFSRGRASGGFNVMDRFEAAEKSLASLMERVAALEKSNGELTEQIGGIGELTGQDIEKIYAAEEAKESAEMDD